MSLLSEVCGTETLRQSRKRQEKDRYFLNLEFYKAFLKARDDEQARRYRDLCIPFQLVVESDEEMFMKGLGSGMEQARSRMREAISNLLAKQILEKFWPIDSFAGADGKLCFGMTAYLLTDEEMGILEDELKEVDRGGEGNCDGHGEDQEG